MQPSPPSGSSSLIMLEKNEPESGEKSEATSEHNNNDYTALRMTYISDNVYEGTVSRWMPHGKGRLVLYDNGGVTYEVNYFELNTLPIVNLKSDFFYFLIALFKTEPG